MFRMLIACTAALLTAMPASTLAQSSRYGDWQVTVNAAATEASTVNQSGSILGFICVLSIDRCIYYVSAHTTCDQGGSSAVLINTDAGALVSTISCIKLGDNYYNSIQDSPDLDTAINKSTWLGIAIPMKSGQFKVVRFSLVGAFKATYEAAHQAAQLEKTVDHMQ